MHFIRYKPDSLNYLIPKFEPNRTSSSRDTAIFVVFYTLGTKKHEKVGYLWNYSSDPAQILGSSSRDCPTCTLWCASTPKSIAFNGKTGVQLEWQCPTFASLSCTQLLVPHFRHEQCQYPGVNVNANDFRKPLAMSMSIPMFFFESYSIPMSMSILFQPSYQCQCQCQFLNSYLNVNINVNVLPCFRRAIPTEQWTSHWFNNSFYRTHLVLDI